jgi:hypothetical protein
VPPLILKSVDWLGVSGPPAAIADALFDAKAAAALDAAAASAACPWSIENDAPWADAVEMVAAKMKSTPATVRILIIPPELVTKARDAARTGVAARGVVKRK